jgi:hypothetical protein
MTAGLEGQPAKAPELQRLDNCLAPRGQRAADYHGCIGSGVVARSKVEILRKAPSPLVL